MALHFRNRLTLTISFLVFLTVAAITVSVAVILARDLVRQYQGTGAILTQVANRNIEYGLTLPPLVHQHIQRRMILQANAVAELVAAAESNERISHEDLSEILKRMVAGAYALEAAPMFDEIRVTDEDGRVIASTDGIDYTFGRGAKDFGQSTDFLRLLEPGPIEPVRQALQPRQLDGKYFMYVGVTGVDRPRIVQVGISAASLDASTSVFQVQDFLERFNLESFRRLMVVADDGALLAVVEPPEEAEKNAAVRARVSAVGKEYLAEENAAALSMTVETSNETFADIGVFTRMAGFEGQPPSALFIQHKTQEHIAHIVSRVLLVVTIGSVMILLGILVGMFVSQGLSEPLVALSKGAREFGQGNLNYRLYLKRKDEFQSLAQAYNTMAISLQEYMHELEQETARRERLESEVRIASDVQRALLPERSPKVEALSVIGWSQPSREVGGDFSDFIELGDGNFGVALGDATGKGISAALMITECASILRTLASDLFRPGELLARTNGEFYHRIVQTHKFVTLSLIVFDPVAGKATYASAGHPPPILVRHAAGKTELLTSRASFPLGIADAVPYTESEVSLEPGDVIVAYSDGFTDAQNHESELFGESRIVSLLEDVAGEPVASIGRALRGGVERHMNGKEPIDDMTMVAVGYRMDSVDRASD
jgi:serine phosphatase RsbU (regulator of sigma subunit)